MPRHRLEPDGIILARLDGTVRRLLRESAEWDTALAEIRRVTTDRRLLGIAAGTALGAWRAVRTHDADRVARMIAAAGADADVLEQQAADTEERLRAAPPGDDDP